MTREQFDANSSRARTAARTEALLYVVMRQLAQTRLARVSTSSRRGWPVDADETRDRAHFPRRSTVTLEFLA